MPDYVLDTSSIRVFGNYYPSRFPAFWENLSEYVSDGRIASVREVSRELDLVNTKSHLDKWAENNKYIFPQPTESEMEFVARIFAIPHFQQLVGEKQRQRGMHVADPFVIASAHVREACVITEEGKKANAGNIPSVCAHFKIDCINVEEFMGREDWRF